jgi:hypothetical protein
MLADVGAVRPRGPQAPLLEVQPGRTAGLTPPRGRVAARIRGLGPRGKHCGKQKLYRYIKNLLSVSGVTVMYKYTKQWCKAYVHKIEHKKHASLEKLFYHRCDTIPAHLLPIQQVFDVSNSRTVFVFVFVLLACHSFIEWTPAVP